MHIGLGNLALVGVGIFFIGDGVMGLPHPGAYAKIAGGIIVIIAAFVS